MSVTGITGATDPATVAVWLQQHGPVEADTIADQFGIPTGTIDAWVADGSIPRGLVLASARGTPATGWTLQTAAAAVAAVWTRVTADTELVGRAAPHVLSVGLYDRNRRAGDPSPALLTARWGWAAVCTAAGVPCGTGRGGYERRWETNDLLRWVGLYATDMINTNHRVTFEGFDRWRANRAGCPSGALVRTRLRTAGYNGWADIVTASVALLRTERTRNPALTG